ncbi:MAG: HEAT repeat domain-containing protein [Phycisphaerales bacterium]|nr:HEAT repeat domain-containing protein [Phycisphaerales bacterium]
MPRAHANRVGLARGHANKALISSILVTILAAGAARADIVYLESGGTVSGRVTSTDNSVVIETVVGRVTLPRSAVERIEKAPTVLDEYETRRVAAGDSAGAQVGLAEWCVANGLKSRAKGHFGRALELDPANSAAREAMGFVRVNGIWVSARGVAKVVEDAPAVDPDDENVRLIEAVQAEWALKIRAIRTNMLQATVRDIVADGRERILAIEDPLAILPLAQVLSRGNVVCRRVLVEALTRFPHDEATMNLALLAITDPDEQVRLVATQQLKKRNDPRVVPQLRRALQSDNDGLIRNAAVALGELGDASAIDDLIEALTAQRRKLVEVPSRSYYGGFTQVFYQPTAVNVGTIALTHSPAIGLPIYGTYPQVGGYYDPTPPRYEKQQVTVFRSEALEALRKITGEHRIGFDKAAWRRWRQEQKT